MFVSWNFTRTAACCQSEPIGDAALAVVRGVLLARCRRVVGVVELLRRRTLRRTDDGVGRRLLAEVDARLRDVRASPCGGMSDSTNDGRALPSTLRCRARRRSRSRGCTTMWSLIQLRCRPAGRSRSSSRTAMTTSRRLAVDGVAVDVERGREVVVALDLLQLLEGRASSSGSSSRMLADRVGVVAQLRRRPSASRRAG